MVAKIIRTPDRSENIELFCPKTWFHVIMFMKHADSCSEHNKYQMKWVQFLSTFNCNIWYVHLFQWLHQHISGIVSIYFLRTSTLMPSATQAKGFPLNVQQIGPIYFPTRSNFARWGWGLDFEVFSPSFSVFRQIPSIASISDNSSFYWYSFRWYWYSFLLANSTKTTETS